MATKLPSPDFKLADLEAFPPLSALPEDDLRCLWILWVAKSSLGRAWLTPGQVADALRDIYSVLVSRQRVEALLSRAKDKGLVARQTKSGRRFYQVMDSGIEAVRSVETSVLFITPQESLTSIRAVEDLLKTFRGTVRICDPYIDSRTLDWLSNCTRSTETHLLGSNIKDRTTKFQRDLLAFKRQYPALRLEVRVSSSGVLHDRYIIDDRQLLIFGTSLNNLGAKQTFVVVAGEDLHRVVSAAFNDGWNAAVPA